MIDRMPLKPGRVKISPEDGSPSYFAVMQMADEAPEQGTPLNKLTLLSDEAVSALKMKSDPKNTVSDAFKHIAEEFSKQLDLTNTKTRIVIGSYTGNGATSREINLGFYPQAVIVATNHGEFFKHNDGVYGGIATRNSTVTQTNSNYPPMKVISISSNGFVLSAREGGGYEHKANLSGKSYTYVAFT